MTRRGLKQLGMLLAAIVGGFALLAVIVWKAAGATEHRAFTLVFYAGGAGLLLFAMITHGAEARGPSDRAINITGALMLAGLLTLGLGVVFETVL